MYGQDTTASQGDLPLSISSGYLTRSSSKATQLEQKLDKKTEKALRQWQKRESRIQRKLMRIDSAKAAILASSNKLQYTRLNRKVQSISSVQQYIPSLDTLSTSLNFFQHNTHLLKNNSQVITKLNTALGNVKGLERQFQTAEEVKAFLKERRQLLREQLQNMGFAKELKRLNKQVYYYASQVKEYKELLKDHKKIERKAIELLSQTKVFQDFMRKNGFLGRLFPSPASDVNNSTAQASGFAGLQTRVQVSSFIQQVSSSGPNAASRMQQNIQDAQSQLTELRSKISQLGAGGEDLDVPDFKINNQKTKSFLKRLEYGTNFQSQRARGFFPATSDFGLSVGYRLTDKAVVGVGASYKLGLGNGWNNIQLSNQGLGVRSYIDWKIKGSFWLSGGYEQNYRTVFNSIDELKELDSWQQSGLIGISKIVSLKTKVFKKTKLQLLWDFLSYRQAPETQPLLFRIGYNF